jgi:enamine deaminase RidA (YjgF/YER057c/UK114 family)
LLGYVTIERTNPDGLHPTPGYHHVTRVQAEWLIYLAGQCPLRPSGELADGGLELAPAFTSASTLLGVAQLGFPGQLVEIDVTAAL